MNQFARGNDPALSGEVSRHHVFGLVIAVFLLHAPSLCAPFFIDDYVYVAAASRLGWSDVPEVFMAGTLDHDASGVWWVPEGTLPFYRPLGQLSFALDHAVWGLNPLGYHLTNVLLHIVCAIGVLVLARRLGVSAVHSTVVAWIFALQPVHSEAVAWISGRFDLLVCAWALAGTLAYMTHRESERGVRWGLVAIACFVLGLCSKETALIWPAVLVGLELMRWNRQRLGRALWVWGVCGVIGCAYLGLRFVLFGGVFGKLPPPYGLDKSSLATAVGGLIWNLQQYVLDFVLGVPIEPAFFAEFLQQHAILTALAAGLCALLVLGAAVGAWRSPAFRLGAGWIVLFTAPSLLAMAGERNVYLASVGLALMTQSAVAAWHQRLLARRARQPGADRMRRLGQVIVGLWCVSLLVKQAMMWGVAATGEKVYRDLATMLPDPPRDARIYVINQSPINCVGFTQALQLRYGRDDIEGCALTLSPTLDPATRDSARLTAADTLQVTRDNGVFFDSFIEQFHLFAAPVEALPAAAQRRSLEIVDAPQSYAGLDTLTFKFPLPLHDQRMQLFEWDNQSLKRRMDLLTMARSTALRRCVLQPVAELERGSEKTAALDSPRQPESYSNE